MIATPEQIDAISTNPEHFERARIVAQRMVDFLESIHCDEWEYAMMQHEPWIGFEDLT